MGSFCKYLFPPAARISVPAIDTLSKRMETEAEAGPLAGSPHHRRAADRRQRRLASTGKFNAARPHIRTRTTARKHAPRPPWRHARRAPMERRAGASARASFTRAPPTRGLITRAAPALHVDVRHVLGIEDAPAHCPATGGEQGSGCQNRAGAISVRQAGHCVATFSALRRI